MRFSLKWTMVATVYAAIAAAALSQETWVYADLLWAATLVAFASALLLSIFARGKRQVAAAGFVLFCACFLGCLHFGNSVPTTRVLLAAGIGFDEGQVMPLPSSPGTGLTARRPIVVAESRPHGSTIQRIKYIHETIDVPTAPILARPLPNSDPYAPGQLTYPVAIAPTPVDFAIYVRAGNAIAAMIFGLLGCLVGSLVFRRIANAKPA